MRQVTARLTHRNLVGATKRGGNTLEREITAKSGDREKRESWDLTWQVGDHKLMKQTQFLIKVSIDLVLKTGIVSADIRQCGGNLPPGGGGRYACRGKPGEAGAVYVFRYGSSSAIGNTNVTMEV
jgi:hypothetical protein